MESGPGPGAADAPPEDVDAGRGRFATLIGRLPWYSVPAILVGVPAFVAVLALAWPTTVYDHFVWPYYWGPIQADAQGLGPFQPLVNHGVAAHSGYNPVNTATWALLLGVCVVGTAQLLRRLRSPMDAPLIVAAATWVAAGSLFHVLEDTGLFRSPLQYVFITPPIYLLFAGFGILSFLLGHVLSSAATRRGLRAGWLGVGVAAALVDAAWILVWWSRWDQVAFLLNPAWVVAATLVAFAAYVAWSRRAATPRPVWAVQTWALAAVLVGAVYLVSYSLSPWPDLRGNLPDTQRPWAWWAPVLAAATTGITFAAARWLPLRRGEAFRTALRAPINLFLVFSQSLDAFATSLGIDFAGYEEKHVLSRALIDGARTMYGGLGWSWGAEHATLLGFVPLKLLISLGVVYVIDGQPGDRRAGQETLIGLVKFAIIMVGLGPGIRDFTRLALGV